MSRSYARGSARERQVADQLREQGYFVVRSAGSHTAADLLAVRPHDCLLVQVKTDKAGPFAHFGPAARLELIEQARVAGGKPLLVHWPPDRGGPRWYWSHEWPACPEQALAESI